MSLWETSFVTKQSHLDSSGRRRSLMLSHRLWVTKSPSGSAGHVGHMSACGCLGFSALYTYTNTHAQIVAQHMCTHTHNIVLHMDSAIYSTSFTFKCHTHTPHLCLCRWLLCCYLVLGFSVSQASLQCLHPCETKVQSTFLILESGSLSETQKSATWCEVA